MLGLMIQKMCRQGMELLGGTRVAISSCIRVVLLYVIADSMGL